MMKISKEQFIANSIAFIKRRVHDIIQTNKNDLIRPYLLVYLDTYYEHGTFRIISPTVQYADRWYNELKERINNTIASELLELSEMILNDILLMEHFASSCEQFNQDQSFFQEIDSKFA
jgi:hypothetical protein